MFNYGAAMRLPRQPPMKTEHEQLEKTRTAIFPRAQDACAAVAGEIAALIRERAAENKTAVLGLATGSTPVRLYRELIRMHREEGLSFKNVVTFNLDEYYPIEPDNKESYFRFMHEQLFNHIDIDPKNLNIPTGTVERKQVYASCRAYEAKIQAAGGVDIQILGIGRSGHIGFNEPGSSRDSRTRMITLDRITRQDAAKDFLGEANVPRYAITMGVATILEARKIFLMAWGEGKAEIVQRAVEGAVTSAVSASFLQEHPEAVFILDEAAAGELTRIKRPWLVGTCDWTPALARRAVVWLSHHLKKPVLKLIDEDYNEHGMGDLATEQGPAYNINIRVFNELQHTITGWPGGKPNADDTHRPERAAPFPKRVIIFAAEPHDDVHYMGGTLHRLIKQGHDVHVVYQTSGNLAVPHDEARKFAEFLLDTAKMPATKSAGQAVFASEVLTFLEGKENIWNESPEVRKIKGIIRRGEARAALRICGVSPDRIHFLDLPFYETGRTRNFQLTEEDIERTASIIDQIKPHQIYAPGDLSDPSSSYRLCYEAMETALHRFASESWLKDCYVWLYRAASREWDIDEIDMAVPLSPDELFLKTKAIYKHQSQKSQVPGGDQQSRESWQIAEARNRATARLYDLFGLSEYEAIEAFRRLKL
jgi:glucosamine-6-phosphate deaminase